MKREAEYDLVEEPPSKITKNGDGSLTKHSQGDLHQFVRDEKLINLLEKKGVKSLFPIQYLTFKHIQCGKDIIARDKTGSGKTLAFSLPIIQKMRENKVFDNHFVKFLIVLPTRQLTIQVMEEIESLRFKDEPDFKVIAVYGKSDINQQIRRINKGIDIIVATPGRLIDLLQRDVIKMNQMRVLCLDEADQMLKQGFKEEVQKIYKYIKDNAPKKTQNLLFSATIPPWLEDLSATYLDEDREYVNLIRKEEISTPKTLEHYSMKITDEDERFNKSKIVRSLMKKFADKTGNTIIFCERKIDVSNLSRQLKDEGVRNEALHGDVIQSKREQAFRSFKRGALKVLVTTNVCARGLDFPDIDLVIQMEPPNNLEPFIHRSGRTARRGREGISVILFTNSKQRYVKNIQREAKIEFKRLRVSDFIDGQYTNGNSKRDNFSQNKKENCYDDIELFIKYLPSRKDQCQIKDFFLNKDIGVQRLKLLKNSEGRFNGNAFIKFSSEEEKEKCLSLDGCQFQGNVLSISIPNRK